MTRQPEAEEHGSKDPETLRGGNWTAVPPNGTYRRTDITRTFRLPATPPVHVPARRLTS